MIRYVQYIAWITCSKGFLSDCLDSGDDFARKGHGWTEICKRVWMRWYDGLKPMKTALLHSETGIKRIEKGQKENRAIFADGPAFCIEKPLTLRVVFVLKKSEQAIYRLLRYGGPEGDRTLEPHGCEPCALPAELRAHLTKTAYKLRGDVWAE